MSLTHFSQGIKLLQLQNLRNDDAWLGLLAEVMTRARVFLFNEECDYDQSNAALNPELSLPFPVCLIEQKGPNVITRAQTRGTDEIFNIFSILALEYGPQTHRFHLWGFDHAGNVVQTHTTEPSRSGYPVSHIVATCMRRLREGALATERVNERLKVRLPSGAKEIVKIKEVIHVHAKRTESAEGLYGGPLDWSHRWEVMGHWRKLEGELRVGKDRDGNRTVRGFTWVVPHTKGPEHKPLIPKVRVV